MSTLWCWWLAALLATGAGCASKDNKESPAEPPPHKPAHSAALDASTPAQDQDSLRPRFKVNGQKVRVSGLGAETEVLSLDGLPALADWQSVIVREIGGREFQGQNPTRLAGARTMVLVKKPAGHYEFRVLDPAGDTGDRPIRHRLDHVKVLEVRTKGYVRPAEPDVPPILLAKGQETELAPAYVNALERIPEPGKEDTRDTFSLLELMGLSAIEAGQSVRLRNAAGKELVLPASLLLDQRHLHIVKRSRRGQFHYRQWTLGEKPTRGVELRGLSEIELR